ncbi:helix-turn-helix domain-containing protein [Nocardia sp. NRRL WC-3656]|uniref:helix-turn-helix domain-containing protein n=1 Tax=Nocardia sp. NRRL WC-3656 TaxID=1463824 RepID=UPI0018CC2F0F|nr:helix-turn-helix transcriptional regulator [Nocardia sp. NRRL WC-3656]
MNKSSLSEVIKTRRNELGLTQSQLAAAIGVNLRQVTRYEGGEQEPAFSVAIKLADALEISLAELAGEIPTGLNLNGDWWAAWETSKDGVPRVDVHTMQATQQGDRIHLDASRAVSVDLEGGTYAWRGEVRLWDNEALIGWYRATDGAVRSKGSMYLALHPHGQTAYGKWVGLSYDGEIVVGWGAIARNPDDAKAIVERLIETNGASRGRIS